MSFAASPAALIRLKAQSNLNGTFTHTLRNRITGETVTALLQTELFDEQVCIEIRIGFTVNRLTLRANTTSTAATLARHLEAIANGQLDTAELSHADLLLTRAA
ncbi:MULTISPECIES: hypothetical protein [unclassified Pseudomonas]|uniref:hypothetical protein n=1 Tax=unclassified Pseudomonas TaxID=196821 RepID=UPI0025E3540C|nr:MULTISPECIES: hypothetical protein [unclassified Pseudomonas]